MALWRIVVKNSGNAACKNKRQRLEKGMFVEMVTNGINPLQAVSTHKLQIAQLFLNKYGIDLIKGNLVNSGRLSCEKIG